MSTLYEKIIFPKYFTDSVMIFFTTFFFLKYYDINLTLLEFKFIMDFEVAEI